MPESPKKAKAGPDTNAGPDVKELVKLDDKALAALAKSYKLDHFGSKDILLHRIMRFLKIKNLWKSKVPKKKRGKKKKKVEVEVNDQHDDDDQDDGGLVVVELVPEVLALNTNDLAFSDVFTKFHELSQRKLIQDEEEDPVAGGRKPFKKTQDDDMDLDLDEEELNMEDPVELRQSKKKLRKLNRMTVAQLKQVVEKPEVVEWVDVTSTDPLLLVALKTARNTVPVPAHWSKKSAYLSGKRGYEKPPFELPEYIKATGIMQLRQTNRGNVSIQAQAKERAHPKLGRLDIDYQKLHDAFFRFQTKPAFSTHGDVYFEGREFDSGLKQRKPGILSDDLKAALNIPPNAPPPWLINMQRYGPPPSYPQLQIPGLNAPIPEGAQWGFHPGGWGKPPTDEYNRPLYGDVFAAARVVIPEEFIAPIESVLWGELEEEEYEEEDEEEEEDEDEEEDANGTGQEKVEIEEDDQPTVEFETGKIDIETDHIELRKDAKRPASTSEQQKSLFTVLPQSKAGTGSSKGFMASCHTYAIPASGSVDVSLNPEDLEGGIGIDSDTLKRKFEETAQRAGKHGREDLSDMVTDHAEKLKKKSRRDEKRDFKF